MAWRGAMVYVRLPQPTHSTVPQAAHMVCLACINALFLSAKKERKKKNDRDVHEQQLKNQEEGGLKRRSGGH